MRSALVSEGMGAVPGEVAGERVVAARPQPREQLPGAAAQQRDALVQRAAEPELVTGDRFGAVPEGPAAGRGATGAVRVGPGLQGLI